MKPKYFELNDKIVQVKEMHLGKRVTIEINVKAKRIMEFKFRTWISFLLIRLVAKILKAAIITDIVEDENMYSKGK